ncbi:phosphate ABC transporter permease PstA [Halarchaeum sp. CBA1220]|uniref:phosphate ABC transporter permease PstA n=1 Tax=Halarchaeum sp. CBA1220 TaxID=1853682 RepID=UPI000F3A80A3|nr:phosphate ABC transporter permease PstA [Halarchaeum sp. CBA1220]QLC33791.1 phosphate ABC transporter permease PstA [Halarchaeum sp. CBA1220]
MSATHDASEAALVDESSSVYDRGLDGVIALGVVSFTVALCALVELVALDATGAALTRFFGAFAAVVVGAVGALALASWTNVAPVRSRRVRGIGVAVAVAALTLTAIAAATGLSLAVILGAILLVEAAGVLVAGVASRTGVVTTTPDSSAGLLAGLVFGVFGLLVGAAVGGSLVGFDTPLWLVVALLAAVGLLVLTVAPREDLGSTLPPALLVGALGATIATAMIGVGWQWDPQAVSGGFTGGAVVPIFVVFGAIVSAWAAAKCRAGFGAQGREFGAFLVINLNAFLMIVVMVAVVVFVTLKGVGYALHGFTISALAALVVLLPAMVLAVGAARSPAGTEAWHDGARALVRVLPLAAVGAVVALLCSVLLTRTPLVYAYTYTVQVNRESRVLDTAVTVTPEFSVGSLLLALVALVLFAAFYRRYGSLRGVGSASATVERARAAVPTVIAALAFVAALFVLAGPTLAGVPFVGTLGVALGALAALAALALLLGALVGLLTGRGERTLAAHAQERAPLLSLGVFGGLGVLTAALALEWAAGIAPSFGAVDVLPAVAFVAALASAGVAVVTALARRRADGIGPLQRAVLADETTLGVAGTAGFVALAGFHVWTADASFGVLGATVAAGGTLSWPMTMQAYIPLGAEPGGIMPAVVGTVWLVIGSTLFAVPLGVGAAVFLTEYAEQGRFTALVEVATNALWSTPSVVFGLFGAAFLIPRLGGDTSLLAGQLVLGFMLLPLVLITSREAIKAVPDEYRDASAALGATRWQTIRSVVLPAAMPGVITGGILGVGRVAGETAPLILVLGSTLNATESVDVLGGFRFVTRPPFIVNDQLVSASASLPTQVWAVIAAGVSGSPSMGWATAFVLLAVVLTFYAVGISARTYFRRKISHD